MNRWLVVAILAGCAGKAAPQPEPQRGSDSMAQQMKPGAPKPSVAWVKGPAMSSPASELVAWFEAQQRNGEPRMTRVPIVLKRGDAGWSTNGVKLGPLEVRVTDSALGIGIAMRANKCTEATCPFVVEGFWRGQADGTYQFEIRNASRHPATPDELAAATHAEVEGESGN